MTAASESDRRPCTKLSACQFAVQDLTSWCVDLSRTALLLLARNKFSWQQQESMPTQVRGTKQSIRRCQENHPEFLPLTFVKTSETTFRRNPSCHKPCW